MSLAFIGKKFNQANLRKLPFPRCLCVFIFPQRQYFPRLGAVAEGPSPLHPFYGPSGQHCPSAPFPHWQHFPRFGAVVVPHFLQRPFHSLRRSCRNPCPTSHLPKVRNRPGPSVAPVPAFLFPAASFHLPKVCRFSAFPSRLPKVRNRPGPSVAPVPAFLFPVSPSKGAQSPGTLCSACTRVSVSSCLFPPSEGVRIFRISVSPSKGAQIPNRL